MTVSAISPWEYAARQFEPRPRRFASPLALARNLDPRTGSSQALRAIDRALVALVDTDDHDGLLVTIPPQEGKSTTCSRRFPEWVLDHNPEKRVAIVSYEAEKALRWGRDIKRDIELAGTELPISIRADSSAAGRWETPEGGGMFCVGIGGPLTGQAVDLLIIDDPVKDRADAESATLRQRAWEWWENVALARFGPGTKTVLIMTRWHEDDLAGRILSRPSPLRWRTLKIPAIAEANDELGRQPGEELSSVRGRKPGYFLNLRANMGAYTFSSIYQQSPTAAEGNFFRRAAFRYWRDAPAWTDGRERIDLEGRIVTLADCWRFGTVDVAASTKTSADYTVISMWAVAPDGDLILLDRVRKQVEQHDHFSLAQPLFAKWGECTLWVEKQWIASTLVADAQNAGIPIADLIADTDKVTRAVPAAGRVHAGRVWFPAQTSGCECGNCPDNVMRDGVRVDGVWLDEWCDELAQFPSGPHDDQVDTLSYAAKIVTGAWTPPKNEPRPGLDPHERTVAQYARSAVGDDDGIDPMTVQY